MHQDAARCAARSALGARAEKCSGRVARRRASAGSRHRRRGDPGEGGHPKRHQLHRSIRRVAVHPFVFPAEGGDEGREIGVGERSLLNRDRDLVALADVAHVDGPAEGPFAGRHAFPVEPLERPPLDLREGGVDAGRAEVVQARDPRQAEIGAHVGDEEAERAQQTRTGRHHDPFHGELAGERGGEERPRAPERHQGEVPWVESLLHRDHADRLDQVLVEDGEHRLGRLLDPEPHRGRHPVGDRAVREIGSQGHAAAEQGVGGKAPEHDVGVGHGGFGSPQAVAGGARIGPGAPRTHVHEAAGVHACDAAPSGAHRMHVDHREPDGVPPELALPGDERPVVLDEAHVGARSPDVEGDDVRTLGPVGEKAGPGDSRRRPRHQAAARHRARLLERGDAAVGLKDLRDHDAHRPRAFAKALEVAAHDRTERGVQHRRRGPLELPELGHDLVRRADEGARQALAHRRRDRRLVGRVVVAVQEADGHCLHAFAPKVVEDPAERAEVRAARVGRSEEIGPFPDLAPQVARHQRRGLRDPNVVVVGLALAADLQDVAKPLGRDEPGDRRVAP